MKENGDTQEVDIIKETVFTMGEDRSAESRFLYISGKWNAVRERYQWDTTQVDNATWEERGVSVLCGHGYLDATSSYRNGKQTNKQTNTCPTADATHLASIDTVW